MAHPPETDAEDVQTHVPKPPGHEEVEEISRAQRFITDDWTGDGGGSDGGAASGSAAGGAAGRSIRPAADAGVDSCDSDGDSGK